MYIPQLYRCSLLGYSRRRCDKTFNDKTGTSMPYSRLTIEEIASILHLTIILRTRLNTFSNSTDRSYKTIFRVYRRSISSVKDLEGFQE